MKFLERLMQVPLFFTVHEGVLRADSSMRHARRQRRDTSGGAGRRVLLAILMIM